MSDSKPTVRYVAYRSLGRGGRGFDFSCGLGATKPSVITIEALFRIFQVPYRIAAPEDRKNIRKSALR